MASLSSFFMENAARQENEKFAVSNRFSENGEAVLWEIKSITSAEDEFLRKSSIKRSQDGRETELDYDLYLGKLAAACTVFPNLNDAQLQKSYGVMGSDALLKEMLLPGEYSGYLKKVQEMNGFHISIEKMADDIKN